MSYRHYRKLSVAHQRVQGNIGDLNCTPHPDWTRISDPQAPEAVNQGPNVETAIVFNKILVSSM